MMTRSARSLLLAFTACVTGACGGEPLSLGSAAGAASSLRTESTPAAESSTTHMPTRSTAGAPMLDPSSLEPIAVSEIIVRDKGSIDIGLAQGGLRVFVSEQLRKRGVNVVGFENVVFGVDKSNSARFLLGSTVIRSSCESTDREGVQVCHLAFMWELFDPRTETVIYRTTTRTLTAMFDRTPYSAEFIEQAISAQVQSLCERPTFAKMLSRGREQGAVKDTEQALTIGELQRCDAKPRELPRDLSGVLEAAVIIRAGNAMGSGTMISPGGIVVTAAHVVGDLAEVEVKELGGEPRKARVLRVDESQDLAVIAVEGSVRSCVPLAVELPAVGEELFVVGTPAAEALAFSVAKGIVSGVRRFGDAVFVQTDAAINPGNSGGAVLDRKGRLVGVVSWKVGLKGFEGLGFAAPAALILPRLALREGEATHIPTTNGRGAQSRSTPPQTVVDPETPIPWRICIDPQTCVSTKEMRDANRK